MMRREKSSGLAPNAIKLLGEPPHWAEHHEVESQWSQGSQRLPT